MDDLLSHCDSCAVDFHRIPRLNSQIKIECWCLILGIIVSVQKSGSNQILLSFALSYAKAVTVPRASRKASDSPELVINRVRYVISCYIRIFAAVREVCIGAVWNAGFVVAVVGCFGQPTIYANEICTERRDKILRTRNRMKVDKNKAFRPVRFCAWLAITAMANMQRKRALNSRGVIFVVKTLVWWELRSHLGFDHPIFYTANMKLQEGVKIPR